MTRSSKTKLKVNEQMEKMDDHQRILTESGTNEVEFIEFYLGDQGFGVNVAKVVQIVEFKESLLTRVPGRHEFLDGTFLFRDRNVPLINLNRALSRNVSEVEVYKPLVLVTQFYEKQNGFLIDGVNRIHRVTWEQLMPITEVFGGMNLSFTGTVNIDEREILIVDLEKIVSEMDPELSSDWEENGEADESEVKAKKEAREEIRVVYAEDSGFLRKSVVKKLKKAGYEVLDSFENGRAAADYIDELRNRASSKGKSVTDLVDVIISDIEMPQMDGLKLCRHLKEELGLMDLPIILFSSLIDEQMAHKCRAVGADSFVSKPQVSDLVEQVDGFCLLSG